MSVQRDWLRRAAEGRVSSPVPFLHWCEVCQVAAEFRIEQAPGLDRGPRSGDLPSRLDGAIEAVHRSEQAQLLVEASALRVRTTEESGMGLAPLLLGLGVVSGRGEDGGDARSISQGKRLDALGRLGEELALARADEVDVPLELVACSLWPARLWGRGSGEALARAALALDPSPEVQLALVRSLVARGRPGAALVELERLAVRRAHDPVEEPAGFRHAVDLARVAAFERRGDLSATLVGLDRVGQAGWPLAGPFPGEDPEDADGADAANDANDANDRAATSHEAEELELFEAVEPVERVEPETEPSREDRLLLESLTLALALLLGDPGVAERALSRMSGPAVTPRVGWEDPLRRAVVRWRASLQGDHTYRGTNGHRGTSGLPDASAGVVFRMLASHDPVLARVAFLVIGG